MKKTYYEITLSNNEKFKENVLFEFKDNIYIFKNNDSIIKINLKEKSFIKESNDNIIYINSFLPQIFLKENNLSFDLEIDKFDIFLKDNYIQINYLILGDESGLKIIKFFI